MKCPVCRAPYRSMPTRECRRCGANLHPLIQLHDRAVWHHHQAIAAFQAGQYAEAETSNDQALALYQNQADFQALAGQLWVLKGHFPAAIAAWQRTLAIDPRHPTATTGLQTLATLIQRP